MEVKKNPELDFEFFGFSKHSEFVLERVNYFKIINWGSFWEMEVWWVSREVVEMLRSMNLDLIDFYYVRS